MNRVRNAYTQVGAMVAGEPYRFGVIDVLIIVAFSLSTLATFMVALAVGIEIGGAL